MKIKPGTNVRISARLLAELEKHGFDPVERKAFGRRFIGRVHEVLDIWDDYWAVIDVECKIPLSCCDPVDSGTMVEV
jgi:hypothetical protein